jgi:TPR repeat protein
MKRLLFATIALIFLAGTTYWVLGQNPEVTPEMINKINKVSRFKELLPKAEAGNAEAQFQIAKMYESGDGVKKDPQQTLDWLIKAADQGHAKARYTLGWMYANGLTVRQDYFLAAKYYRLAATFNNDSEAQYRMGELHFNGRGVENDYGKAIEYYQRAAKQGHAAAQFILSSMYEEGWGVKRDLVMSYVWLKLAERKSEEAKAINKKFDPARKMANLREKMNNFQVEQGEKRLLTMKIR